MNNGEDLGKIVQFQKVDPTENTHIYNDHALIHYKVTVARDYLTQSTVVCPIIKEITLLMAAYALANLSTREVDVTTPICKTKGVEIAGKKLALVPIWRAGDPMAWAMKDLVPTARIGSAGVYRDKDTSEPVPYFWKMPKDMHEREAFVLDPMLATGGTMEYTIRRLKEQEGCKTIHAMCVIAAPQGMGLIQDLHPDVDLHIAHLDEGLNRFNYIVPGLGDAGDRIFGTK